MDELTPRERLQQRREERLKLRKEENGKNKEQTGKKNRFISAMEEEPAENEDSEDEIGEVLTKRDKIEIPERDKFVTCVPGGYLVDQDNVVLQRYPRQAWDIRDRFKGKGDSQDGIYVENALSSTVPERNKQKLKARYEREGIDGENEKWFDEHGQVKSIFNPIRSMVVEHEGNVLNTVSVRVPQDLEKFGQPGKMKSCGTTQYAALQIHIDSMRFMDHESMTLEEKLCLEMWHMYDAYCKCVIEDPSMFYARRALKIADSMDDESSQHVALNFMQELEQAIQHEDAKRKGFQSLYLKWKQIKETRKKVGYKTTSIVLVARKYQPQQVPNITNKHFAVIEQTIDRENAQDTKAIWQKRLHSLIDAYEQFSNSSDAGKFVLKLSEEKDFVNISINDQERMRRDQIKKCKVYACLIVNGARIASTPPKCISWPSFQVKLDHQIDLYLVSRPKSIQVQLFQKTSLLKKDISLTSVGVPLVIPGESAHAAVPIVAQSESNQIYEFASKYQISNSAYHESFYYQVKESKCDRRTTGFLQVAAAWSTDDEFAVKPSDAIDTVSLQSLPEAMARTKYARSNLIGHGLVATGMMNSSADEQIAEFARERDFLALLKHVPDVDVNDPSNKTLVRLRSIYFSMSDKLKRRDVFHAAELYEQLLFNGTNRDKYQLSRRHRLIQLRKDRPDSFSTPIPIHESEIKANDVYMTLLRPEVEAIHDDDDHIDDPQAAQRIMMKRKVTDFIRSVRDSRIATNRKQRAKKVHISSIVQERVLPVQDMMSTTMFSTLFQRRRALKPKTSLRPTYSTNVTACRLFIQIESASNIPIRKSSLLTNNARSSKKKRRSTRSESFDESEQDSDDDLGHASKLAVAPYVEVRFQDNKRRTSCSDGPNPIWMETLVLPFVPPMGDFSPKQLEGVKDQIYVNLFDELFIDDRDQGGHYAEENANYVRNESRYLGTLAIPFTTVYLNTKIRGSCKCDIPLYQFGYCRTKEKNVVPSMVDDKAQNDPKTYISIMATLDPPLPLVETLDEIPETGEGTALLAYASNYLDKVRNHNETVKRRYLQVMATDINGDAVIITRYLKPQAPPKGVDTILKAARFVSLIPFLDDWQAFSGEADLWNTSQQFLDIRAGDWEEHAVLLCNYFEYLDRKKKEFESYLVLAHAVPEGKGLYVLRLSTLNKDDGIIWNATTGDGYHIKDPKSPIQNVGMVATRNNIWTNVQQDGIPSSIQWDMEKSAKHWKPFFNTVFTRQMAGKLPTVQVEQLLYPETDRGFVLQVETDIQETLKIHIRRWRSKRFTTAFHTDAGFKLRKLLVKFEEHKLGNINLTESEHNEGLGAISHGDKTVYGTPLNLTFTDTDRVIEAIKNTNIYWNEHPSVQFGLSVYVHAYSSDILSVWVYLVSLTPSK